VKGAIADLAVKSSRRGFTLARNTSVHGQTTRKVEKKKRGKAKAGKEEKQLGRMDKGMTKSSAEHSHHV